MPSDPITAFDVSYDTLFKVRGLVLRRTDLCLARIAAPSLDKAGILGLEMMSVLDFPYAYNLLHVLRIQTISELFLIYDKR